MKLVRNIAALSLSLGGAPAAALAEHGDDDKQEGATTTRDAGIETTTRDAGTARPGTLGPRRRPGRWDRDDARPGAGAGSCRALCQHA
jgi:hypothetical protein